MNIVHLVSNKVWGGGERYALDLCCEALAQGHRVMAYTRRIEAVMQPFIAAGIATATLPLRGAFDIVTPLKLSKALDRLCAADSAEPTIVHVHNFKDAGSAISARRLMTHPERVKIVCTRHLVKPAKTTRSATERYRALDAIIFVSQLAKEAFMKSNPDVDTAKIHVVPNSIRLPHPIAPMTRGDDTGGVNLLYVGRIHPEKGLDTLVRALDRLRDISDLSLRVCGTGSSRDVMPVVRLARGLDVDKRIAWLGHVDDVYAEMRRADIGILPSVAPESSGLVLLEYMMHSLPAVTTDSGAQKEIITDGDTGRIVAAGDDSALADALRQLITDAELRREMGARAYATFAKRYAYDKFFAAIMQIYHNPTAL